MFFKLLNYKLFSSPILLLSVLATLLLIPAVNSGFILDDYVFIFKLSSSDISQHIFNLYDFYSYHEVEKSVFNGYLPWWSDSSYKMSFYRPLSSLLFSLDFLSFAHHPLPYHLHSLLWVFSLIFTWHAIFKLFVSYRVNILALIILICSGVFLFPVLYVANRHILIATTLASLGFLCHLLYRRKGFRYGLPLSLFGFLMGLLASEAALCVFIYLFSYEWILSKDGVRKRCVALLPYIVLLAIYFCLYKVFHYGTSGINFYVDPFRSTVKFIQHALIEFPSFFDELYFRYFFKNYAIINWTLPVTTGGIFLLWLLKKDKETRLVSVWFLVSSLFSLLPILTTPIEPFFILRVLLPSMIGASAVLATLMVDGWHQRHELISNPSITNIFLIIFTTGLAVVNLIISPIMMVIISKEAEKIERIIESNAINLGGVNFTQNPACKYVVNIATAKYALDAYIPSIRSYYNLFTPPFWFVLADRSVSARVTKINAHQFVLESQPYNDDSGDQSSKLMFQNNHLKNGQTVQTKIFKATVLEYANKVPTKTLFDFNEESLSQICWISFSPVV